MARDRLRVRRLTLLPAPRSEGQVDKEAEAILAKELLARSIEVTVETSSKTGRVNHGVEDRTGYRFWALSDSESSSEEDDDVESMVSMDTLEFV